MVCTGLLVYNLLISNRIRRSTLWVDWAAVVYIKGLVIYQEYFSYNKENFGLNKHLANFCTHKVCGCSYCHPLQSCVWSHASIQAGTMLRQGLHHAVKTILHLTGHLTALVMLRQAELVMPKWCWLILSLASSQCFSSSIGAHVKQRRQSRPETRHFLKSGAANQYNISWSKWDEAKPLMRSSVFSPMSAVMMLMRWKRQTHWMRLEELSRDTEELVRERRNFGNKAKQMISPQ